MQVDEIITPVINDMEEDNIYWLKDAFSTFNTNTETKEESSITYDLFDDREYLHSC